MDGLKGLKPLQAMAASMLFKHRCLLLTLPRQEGKTELGVRLNADILGRAFSKQTLFLAKDHKSGKRATREKFSRLCTPDLFTVNTENVYLKKMPSSVCYMESVDKDPDRMRGGTYSYIHWTEVAFSRLENGVKIMDVYDKVIKPTTKKTKGYILCESTNNGMNGWYDLWENAKELGFATLCVPYWMMAEMGIVSMAEYEETKSTTLPLTFEQEYECKFVSPKGKTYVEFTDKFVTKIAPPEGWQQVIMAIDWGYHPSATCVLFAYVLGGCIYVFAEHYAHEERTDVTKERILGILEAADCESYSGVADHEQDRIDELNRAGIPCGKASKADVLGARIQIKTLFHQGRIFIDPSCRNLIRELHTAVWNEKPGKDGEIDMTQDNIGHFDAEAAFRYLVRELSDTENLAPVKNPQAGRHDASAREFAHRNNQRELFQDGDN